MTEPRGGDRSDRKVAGSKIGEENQLVVPVAGEEVVIRKRPVVKEVLRIRKVVVEEEEVVETDVRKEEVDVVDETERGLGRLGP